MSCTDCQIAPIDQMCTEHEHHHHHHHHHHSSTTCGVTGDIVCVCESHMLKGKIKQGQVHCSVPGCRCLLTSQICYYCPCGSNDTHRNGMFLCLACSEQFQHDDQMKDEVKQSLKPNFRQRLLRRRSLDNAHVMKQGYMNKKGLIRSTYRKSYFKLYDNQKLVSREGQFDLSNTQKVEKHGQFGITVTTNKRSFSFILTSSPERDDWSDAFASVCLGINTENSEQLVIPAEFEPVTLIEDDTFDLSFITENLGNFEEDVPPEAYSQPSSPRLLPTADKSMFFSEVDGEALPEIEGADTRSL